mmetsp:Transcript_21690/g.47039  ORF Transcript_21690/g.47039 Transcript_21690/m.47039 type:complete len:394 (+) Transcript_21690:1515-2696(+)
MNLFEIALGNGVEENTSDCDTRADDALRGHRGAEHDNGGQDDHHALDGIAEGVRDRRDVVEGEEGHLVVQVVEERRGHGLHAQGLGQAGGLDARQHGPDLLALQHEGHWEAHAGCQDGHDGVEVGGVHVLALRLAHALLAHDASGGRGHVGDHGRAEAQPGERQLRQGGHRDSTHHGEQREVDGDGHEGLEEHRGQQGRHGGLGGLHNVREAHRPGTERHHCTKMRKRVQHRNGEQGLHLTGRQLGRFAHAQRPDRQHVCQAHKQLQKRKRVGQLGNHVQDLLVVNVVPNVQRIPQSKQKAKLHCLQDAAALLRSGSRDRHSAGDRLSRNGGVRHCTPSRGSRPRDSLQRNDRRAQGQPRSKCSEAMASGNQGDQGEGGKLGVHGEIRRCSLQ